jgi:hypothetical protein
MVLGLTGVLLSGAELNISKVLSKLYPNLRMAALFPHLRNKFI